jgi:hypothetical protein
VRRDAIDGYEQLCTSLSCDPAPSCAALDPETLHQALQCVLQRAPMLLVIAHP